MIFGGDEDNNLASFCHLVQNVEKSTWLILRPDHKGINGHLLRQGYLLVHIAILLEANLGKLVDSLIDGRTEHKPLRNGALLRDLLQLVIETTILE